MADRDFDLLGDPIPENFGKRGRPPHVPTVENRNKIIVLMAMDWSDERIAAALGITKPTLKKHYFREMRVRKEARDRVDGARIMMLWNQAREGNVAAIKEYNRLVEKLDIEKAAKAYSEDEPTPRAQRLGKKEAAQIAAQTAGAGSEWGDDLLGEDGRTRH